MYNSLTFYYSNSSLKDCAIDLALPFNVPGQLQTNQEWLHIEQYQHQQLTSNLMYDYEISYGYDTQGAWALKQPTSLMDPVYIQFTPLALLSSKVFYSQLSMCPARSMFPGLILDSSESPKFQPLEWQKFNPLDAESFASDCAVFHQLLSKFVAWFKFSKMYLAFYVHKVNLEEDGQISETFSNNLLCHWLRNRLFGLHTQKLETPYMEPPNREVHDHLKRLKDQINRLKTVSQSTLICELNLLIHQWVEAWDLNIRWTTLTYCEDWLRRRLQRWAKRRHPNKGWGWVCHKYWRVGPTASKGIFWLWLLSNVCEVSNLGRVTRSPFKAQLVNLVQMRLCDCVNDISSFTTWQFFCLESREGLFPYSVMSLKKWRKSRAFDSFLLY